MKKSMFLCLCLSFLIFGVGLGEVIIKNPKWRDGEEFSYDVRFKGELVGRMDYLIGDTLVEETKAYFVKVTTLTGYLGMNTFDSVSLVINQENLKPLKLERISVTPEIIKRVQTIYLKDKVKIRIDNPFGSEEREIDFPDDGYDSEEVILLLRAMTYNKINRLTFSNISSMSATSIPVEVRVLKSENMKVPLGEFLCNKLEMKIREKEVELWYQKSKPHLMVKYSDKTTETEIILNEYKPYSELKKKPG